MTYDEMLDEMCTMPNVTVRSIGVITRFLRKNHDYLGGHEEAKAKAMIEELAAADIYIFIGADLNGFIDAVGKAGA